MNQETVVRAVRETIRRICLNDANRRPYVILEYHTMMSLAGRRFYILVSETITKLN